MLEIIVLAAQPNELNRTRETVQAITELAEEFQIESTHVVTGSDHRQVKLALAQLPVTLIYNPYWQDGLGHSIAAGIQDAHYDTEAVLLVEVGDRGVDLTRLRELLGNWFKNKESMALRDGLPAVFAAETFPELAALVDERTMDNMSVGHFDKSAQTNQGY